MVYSLIFYDGVVVFIAIYVFFILGKKKLLTESRMSDWESDFPYCIVKLYKLL